MVNDQPNKAAAISFLRQVVGESSRRIMNANFDPENEERELQRYLGIAHEVGAPLAISDVYYTLSLLHYSVGRFKESIEDGDRATEEALRSPYGDVRVNALLPLSRNADTYHDLGDTLSALELSTELLGLARQPDLAPHITDIHTYIVKHGHYHLALESYNDAEVVFRQALAATDQRGDDYPLAVAEAYRGLSEIDLHRGDFQKAWTNARLAHEIAYRQPDNMLHFYVNCTMAHVAENDPHSEIGPEGHYAATLQMMDIMGTPVLRAVALIHEARFHARSENVMRAKQFAALAANILHSVKVSAFDIELHHLIKLQ